MLGLAIALGSSGCLFRRPSNVNPLAAVKSNQPDKVLYDIAMTDLGKGKYTVARLNLETLLNTYPDSEYLAQAKLAIADSWYRQGGAEGYAQAEAQYKDFITFFPAMKEAAQAQLKIATIHFQQIAKPDRDPTQAQATQAALRTFLRNYPTSSLRPQALQMLRETQEVLAERLYRIGEFYLDRAHQGEYTNYRAAQNRLEELLNTYPLYSQGDKALDDLAHSYLTTSSLYAGAAKLNIGARYQGLYNANANADRAQAVADFDRLIHRYPLSPLAADAKKQLTALHQSIPTPTTAELAFNRAELKGRGQAAKNAPFWMNWGFAGLISTHPDTEFARADKVGNPPLSQPPAPSPTAPPGLEALLRQSLIASGAITAGHKGPLPLGNAQLTAELAASDPVPGANSAAATTTDSATAAAANDPSAAPLSLEGVPTATQNNDSPLVADAPQAVSGSNADDPNARPTTANANANVIITPNELDLENQDQILAADVQRSVPAPVQELEKTIAKEHLAPGPTATGTATQPDLPSSTQHKSLFRRLLP